MEPFHKRLIKEQEDIQKNMEGLQKAFDSGAVKKLPLAQQYLMEDQLKTQKKLNKILLVRLSLID